jgi:hypothetical protein
MGIVSGLRVASLFVAYAGVGWTGERVADLVGRDATQRDRVEFDIAIDFDRDFESEIARRMERDVRVEVRTLRGDECAVEIERDLTISWDTAERLAIDAGAGSLRVEGVEGSSEVRAIGRVCASSAALAEELQLTLERVGDELRLSAHYPDNATIWGRGNRTARIDLEVTVPRGSALDIDDSSGEIEVAGSGALQIDDSSGEIVVRDALGSVTIDDSSGEILVAGAAGDVDIEDGSGEIDVRGVEGSVLVRDGSGSIQVSDVTQSVRVEADGSGSIDVRNVGGDFAVDREGSGGIRHSGVAGAVDIPERQSARERRARRDL